MATFERIIAIATAAAMVGAVPRAAASDARSDARWSPAGALVRFIASDEAGFWVRTGEHFRLDGKQDVALPLPPGTEIDRVATSPKVTAVVGAVNGGGDVDTPVLVFDRRGKALWDAHIRPVKTKAESGVKEINGLGIDASGRVLLSGLFAGCVRFGGGKAPPTCVDDKAARRFPELCDSDGACRAPFVVTYEAGGGVQSVFTPAGFPARFFALAPDGRVALAGYWSRKIDLDPDPAKMVQITMPPGLKPPSTGIQPFWSIFDRSDTWRWVDGKGIAAPGGAAIEDLTFDVQGALVMTIRVRPSERGALMVATASGATPLGATGSSGHVVVIVGKQGAVSTVALNDKQADSNGEFQVLPTAGRGLFAFGKLPTSPSAPAIEPDGARGGLAVVGVHGIGEGWALRVPDEGFKALAAVVRGGEVCLGFDVVGERTLPGASGPVTFGESGIGHGAIGCFRLPAKGGARSSTPTSQPGE